MDKNLSQLNDMLHKLKYDANFSDLMEYAIPLQQLIHDLKSAQDLLAIVESTGKIKIQDLENELRETKASYVQTINKLKHYKKRNGEQRLRLEEIKRLASGGAPRDYQK